MCLTPEGKTPLPISIVSSQTFLSVCMCAFAVHIANNKRQSDSQIYRERKKERTKRVEKKSEATHTNLETDL